MPYWLLQTESELGAFGRTSEYASDGVVPGILGPNLMLMDAESVEIITKSHGCFLARVPNALGLLRGLYERRLIFKNNLDTLAGYVDDILPQPLLKLSLS